MSEQHARYHTDNTNDSHWCPKHAGGYLRHCWHTLGVGEERWAGQDVHERLVEEQCCWCGARRWRSLYDRAPGLHGPHAPGAATGSKEEEQTCVG